MKDDKINDIYIDPSKKPKGDRKRISKFKIRGNKRRLSWGVNKLQRQQKRNGDYYSSNINARKKRNYK